MSVQMFYDPVLWHQEHFTSNPVPLYRPHNAMNIEESLSVKQYLKQRFKVEEMRLPGGWNKFGKIRKTGKKEGFSIV